MLTAPLVVEAQQLGKVPLLVRADEIIQ